MEHGADPLTLLGWALILVNCLVYFAFKGMATVVNRIFKKETLHRRWMGALGVIIFAAITVWYVRAHFNPGDLSSNLSPVEKARQVGRVTGTLLSPSILVLAVVAFRGWRSSKKRDGGNTRSTFQPDSASSVGPAPRAEP
jgi:hypothetical protein